MDQRIRKLQRQAWLGDASAAERLEYELGRIGREALRYRTQPNLNSDPIESIQIEYDRKLIHKKMGKGWSQVAKIWWGQGHHPPDWMIRIFGVSPPFLTTLGYIFVNRWKPGKARHQERRPNNSKRKTLRTHRNPRARK